MCNTNSSVKKKSHLFKLYLFVLQQMKKGRNQSSSVWQSPKRNQIYLDSAYKQLVNQEQKATALRNRTNVLTINQNNILRRIQNNQNKLSQIQSIKQAHSLQTSQMNDNRKKKNQMTEQRRLQNQKKREQHEAHMKTISEEKDRCRNMMKEEVLRMKKENNKLIEFNRKTQMQKKKDIHNKIHQDIMESRTTIKNFFAQKHESIVLETKEEIKKLNKKRIHEKLTCQSESGKLVVQMEAKIKELKDNLRVSKIGFEVQHKQSQNSFKKGQSEQLHPLVRKIEDVINRYTRFL